MLQCQTHKRGNTFTLILKLNSVCLECLSGNSTLMVSYNHGQRPQPSSTYSRCFKVFISGYKIIVSFTVLNSWQGRKSSNSPAYCFVSRRRQLSVNTQCISTFIVGLYIPTFCHAPFSAYPVTRLPFGFASRCAQLSQLLTCAVDVLSRLLSSYLDTQYPSLPPHVFGSLCYFDLV